MPSYNSIASAIRKAGLPTCTATTLFHLGFLNSHNIDDKGFIHAKLYRQAGTSFTFNGYGMEGVLTFLGVAHEIVGALRLEQAVRYKAADLYTALREMYGIDIVGERLSHETARETAMQLKGMRDAHYAQEAAKVEPDEQFYDELMLTKDLKANLRRVLHGSALQKLMNRRGYEWKPEIIPFWSLFKLVRKACEEKYKAQN